MCPNTVLIAAASRLSILVGTMLIMAGTSNGHPDVLQLQTCKYPTTQLQLRPRWMMQRDSTTSAGRLQGKCIQLKTTCSRLMSRFPLVYTSSHRYEIHVSRAVAETVSNLTKPQTCADPSEGDPR